jgi:hypothetical protein
MSVLPGPRPSSGLRRVGEVSSDLLIATAVIWSLPLAFAVLAAVFRFLLGFSN